MVEQVVRVAIAIRVGISTVIQWEVIFDIKSAIVVIIVILHRRTCPAIVLVRQTIVICVDGCIGVEWIGVGSCMAQSFECNRAITEPIVIRIRIPRISAHQRSVCFVVIGDAIVVPIIVVDITQPVVIQIRRDVECIF